MAVSPLRRGFHIFLAVFWLVAFSWMFYSLQAQGVDPSVFESGPSVRVGVSDTALTFTPLPDTAGAALLFYPGALVDPDAYAPLARAVAEAGYEVVVVKVPFRMAVLASQRETVDARSEAFLAADARGRAWVVGGHSRGGKMATQFAPGHADALAGLLLVGTSHPREDDLSDLPLDVTKVYASEDGLASEEEVHGFAGNLPDDTHWVRIEGGNHAQFGWYGRQLGDGHARIDRAEQHRQTVAAVVDQLGRLSAR